MAEIGYVFISVTATTQGHNAGHHPTMATFSPGRSDFGYSTPKKVPDYETSGLPFDASSEVHGGGDLALAVGGCKVRGENSSRVWGKGVTAIIPHNLLRVKNTRSSFKPAIYLNSGLSLDASSKVHGGEDFALEVGGGKVRSGNSRVWDGGVTRAELQKGRDGGNSLLATADSSIRQQQRFCSLGHARSSYKPDIYLDRGLSLDESSDVHGGKDLALAVRGGKVKGENSRRVWGEVVTRAELQKERGSGNSLFALDW